MPRQKKESNENIIKMYNILTDQMNKSVSMEKQCKRSHINSWFTLIVKYIIFELLMSLVITFITNNCSLNIKSFLSIFGYLTIFNVCLIVYIWKFIDKHNEFSNFIIKNKTINTTDFNRMLKKHSTSYSWLIVTSFETTVNLIINIKTYKYHLNEIMNVRTDIIVMSQAFQLNFIKKFLTVQKIKNPKNDQDKHINYLLADLDKSIKDLGNVVKEIYSDFSIIYNKAIKEINNLNNPLEMFYYKIDDKYEFDEVIAFQFKSTLQFMSSVNLFSIIDMNKLDTLVNDIDESIHDISIRN